VKSQKPVTLKDIQKHLNEMERASRRAIDTHERNAKALAAWIAKRKYGPLFPLAKRWPKLANLILPYLHLICRFKRILQRRPK
jgi:hypothetical protein